MSSTAAIARISRLAPRLAEEARERVRLTVVPRPRQRTSGVPFIALVTLVMLGGVVGLLLFNTSMQQASFAATALQGQADSLTARQQTLAMDLDGLRDPQRVALEARKLGMTPSCSPIFLRLGSAGSPARVLGQPAPATTDCSLRVAPYPARLPASLRTPPTVITVPAIEPGTPAGSAATPTQRGAEPGPARAGTRQQASR